MLDHETYWRRQREKVRLKPGTIYLNTGSFAPLTDQIWEVVTALRQRLFESPSNFFWRQSPPLMTRARRSLADYLHVRPEDLLLLPNATTGINIVSQSLSLEPGDEILTTDQEYGAMLSCWRRRARQDGLTVREVPIPIPCEHPDQIARALEDALSPRTKILFFSHVTSPSGLVLPAERLCALATQHGVRSVVDGAHAPGMVPLDLESLGADFYAGNCHKWMMAPTGAGFLHVKAARQHELESIITSWGWDYPADDAEHDSGWGGTFWARDLEFHGTQDRCSMMVLPEVLGFRAQIGEERRRLSPRPDDFNRPGRRQRHGRRTRRQHDRLPDAARRRHRRA